MTRGKAKRDYDEAFKEQAVKMVTERKRSMLEVSKDLGVPHNTVQYWVRCHRRKARCHDGPASAAELARRVADLERENARLRLEREILKKATALFASPSP